MDTVCGKYHSGLFPRMKQDQYRSQNGQEVKSLAVLMILHGGLTTAHVVDGVLLRIHILQIIILFRLTRRNDRFFEIEKNRMDLGMKRPNPSCSLRQ
jgi:uncharacterized membrane protein